MKNCCKIKTYIGFAKKSRNVIYGVDDIIKLIKKCDLILAAGNLAESSFSKLSITAQKNNKQVYVISEQDFEDCFDSKFIKAAAITDKNLSDAIKNGL